MAASVSPTRTCVGCRKRGPATEMSRLRVVEGQLVLGAGDGRGASLHRSAACFDAAQKTGAFARAFKRAVAIRDAATLLRQLIGSPQ